MPLGGLVRFLFPKCGVGCLPKTRVDRNRLSCRTFSSLNELVPDALASFVQAWSKVFGLRFFDAYQKPGRAFSYDGRITISAERMLRFYHKEFV